MPSVPATAGVAHVKTDSRADLALASLPHGAAFRFVEAIAAIDLEHIVAHFHVRHDDPILGAHFPGFPVVPGALLIEAMAQAAAVLAVYRGDYDPSREVLLLMTVEEAKFRQMVQPECRVELVVVPLRTGKLWRGRGVARVGDQTMAESTFVAAIRARPRASLAADALATRGG